MSSPPAYQRLATLMAQHRLETCDFIEKSVILTAVINRQRADDGAS